MSRSRLYHVDYTATLTGRLALAATSAAEARACAARLDLPQLLDHDLDLTVRHVAPADGQEDDVITL